MEFQKALLVLIVPPDFQTFSRQGSVFFCVSTLKGLGTYFERDLVLKNQTR